MNTFQSGINLEITNCDIQFEYQVGSVKTTIPWFQPTKHILNKFIKTIPKIKNYDKYELFLVGGVVNGRIGKTWDVDIVVSGNIVPEEFESFLHEIYDIALNKFNILVDVRWFNVPIGQFNHLVETQQVQRVKTIRFGFIQKTIGDKVSTIDLFKKGNKIGEHLVELYVILPTIEAFESKMIGKYIKI